MEVFPVALVRCTAGDRRTTLECHAPQEKADRLAHLYTCLAKNLRTCSFTSPGQLMMAA